MSSLSQHFSTSLDVVLTLRWGWLKNPVNVDITSMLVKKICQSLFNIDIRKSACSYKLVKQPSRDVNVLFNHHCSWRVTTFRQMKFIAGKMSFSNVLVICMCTCAVSVCMCCILDQLDDWTTNIYLFIGNIQPLLPQYTQTIMRLFSYCECY